MAVRVNLLNCPRTPIFYTTLVLLPQASEPRYKFNCRNLLYFNHFTANKYMYIQTRE